MKNLVIEIAAICFVCACSAESPIEDPGSGGTDAVAGVSVRGPVATAPLPDPVPGLAPEHVTAIADLVGDWYRPFALPGQISYLTLTPMVSAVGEYYGYRSCGLPICLPIGGAYYAVPENPAIGFAFLQLSPAPGESEIYVLDAYWRTDDGEVAAIQLRRLYTSALSSAPFYLYRMAPDAEPEPQAGADEQAVVDLANQLDLDRMTGDGELDDDLAAALVAERADGYATTADVTAAADRMYAANPALCSYYQGLAEYYAIRALQCAYSVCYPLSPWYGFWAQYYSDLAADACGDEG